MNIQTLIAAGLISVALSLSADSVYKWTDADGNVNYAADPPPSGTRADSVPIQPGPSAERQQEAQDRVRQMEEEAGRMERQRLQAQEERQQVTAGAEKEVQDAKIDLERARVQHPEDWQTIGEGGGRFLKEDYYERVREAEATARTAEDQLTKARRDAKP